MKKILRTIIIFILTQEAKLVLMRFKPKIIGITGSVGKTSTKDAIFSALSDSLHIRKNQKSFNSEIGVPLTILGLDNAYNDFLRWAINLIEGLFVIFKRDYPEWLVLELGVDHPKDMEKLMKWIKLDIAVFTRFPTVPVHVEYFSSPKEVIEEKKKMMLGVKKDGYVILNADDAEVLHLKDESKRKVLTFGIDNNHVDIKVSNQEIIYKDEKPKGLNFKIDYSGNSVPVNLEEVLGNQHVYPVLAAFACGISQGLTTIEMIESFKKHKASPGRMNLIDGINDSVIIDDSYNASPIAVQEALRVLSNIKAKTKIAVLGDMSEIGRFTASEHKIIGKMITDLKIDYLLTFGKKAEFIFEEAVMSGTPKDRAFPFSDRDDLILSLKDLAKEGSVILIKGSQSSRMEKITKSIMKNPEEAKNLLVRQDEFWENK